MYSMIATSSLRKHLKQCNDLLLLVSKTQYGSGNTQMLYKYDCNYLKYQTWKIVTPEYQLFGFGVQQVTIYALLALTLNFPWHVY